MSLIVCIVTYLTLWWEATNLVWFYSHHVHVLQVIALISLSLVITILFAMYSMQHVVMLD